MGACATKPGDLKVKGEAPLVVEDAVAAAAEKAKADGIPVAAAVVDQTDVSRRRSLSDLLKRDAEASDGKAGHQEAEKVVVGEPASAVGETMGPPQAPVQASVAAVQDDTAEEPEDGLPSGDAHAAEEEKRVDPESVQAAVAADAPKSSEESEAANDDDDASA
ncbi:hypothetical protein Zm00014a_011739 [Zea mays]|uniref:NF-180 n=2 Tax=Zea mays TaxID=4577 RepID=A0A8J8XXY0_MAIZE|nr:NF-180 [Zea mays]PWZ25650.1 hypothetical protein Zm00014a_011739 [Zea mays]|eukprot:NP_001150900.1 NF-180 [Zea mays]